MRMHWQRGTAYQLAKMFCPLALIRLLRKD